MPLYQQNSCKSIAHPMFGLYRNHWFSEFHCGRLKHWKRGTLVNKLNGIIDLLVLHIDVFTKDVMSHYIIKFYWKVRDKVNLRVDETLFLSIAPALHFLCNIHNLKNIVRKFVIHTVIAKKWNGNSSNFTCGNWKVFFDHGCIYYLKYAVQNPSTYFKLCTLFFDLLGTF